MSYLKTLGFTFRLFVMALFGRVETGDYTPMNGPAWSTNDPEAP